jgi:hypothetical protein
MPMPETTTSQAPRLLGYQLASFSDVRVLWVDDQGREQEDDVEVLRLEDGDLIEGSLPETIKQAILDCYADASGPFFGWLDVALAERRAS